MIYQYVQVLHVVFPNSLVTFKLLVLCELLILSFNSYFL